MLGANNFILRTRLRKVFRGPFNTSDWRLFLPQENTSVIVKQTRRCERFT